MDDMYTNLLGMQVAGGAFRLSGVFEGKDR